jgi:hypothetical protein
MGTPSAVPSDAQMLDRALTAFHSGGIEQAEKLFSELLMGTTDEEMARQALYGLACSRLVLADSAKDQMEAYGLWRAWYELPTGPPPGEDPRLLGPVFERLIPMPRAGSHLPEDGTAALSAGSPGFEDLPASLSPSAEGGRQDLDREEDFRQLLPKLETEIEHLKAQLEKMRRENRALKKQLMAIEEIHKEISQKKKGIQEP